MPTKIWRLFRSLEDAKRGEFFLFYDNYCQLRRQLMSILGGVILLCMVLIDFASMLAVYYSALKASFIAEYHPTIYRL